jgi:RNA 2',3'-cyclic 3'-phosphodiesterase
MKRLFAAVKINPDKAFMDRLHRLESQLKHEKIKWVEDQNIHITLKFFGETEEERIPGISRVLQAVAEKTPVFGLSLKGLGVFGSSYNPKVVWAGIEPYDHLAGLMKMVHTELATIGFEPDRQNLVPHLTIGRIRFLKDKSLFQKILDAEKEIASEAMIIDSFHLYESILRREGPLYIALKTFPLVK